MNQKEQLLAKIDEAPYTVFKAPALGAIDLLALTPETIFSDVSWLFGKYPYLGLFENASGEARVSDVNSWILEPPEPSMTLATVYLLGNLQGDRGDYLANYLLLGTSCSDGGVGIGIAPEVLGKIAFCTFTALTERSNVPIVANSFAEWLERTIDLGPGEERYWELPDFVDLGSAIPDDPNYEPIGRVE